VLRIGSSLLRTSAHTDRATLQRQGRVTLVPCGSATADVGDGTRVVAPASALLRPVAVTLRPALGDQLAAEPPADLPLALPRWTATSRAVDLPVRAEPTVLRVHENTNPGWVAELAGRRLKPVVLDGWQQGWVVPPGEAATLQLRYAPDRTYRVGLLVGAGAVVLLLLIAAWRGRRPDRRPPVPAQAVGGRAPLLLGAALLVLIGGWAAVPLMALAVVLPLRRVRVPLAAGAVLAAGGLLARAPWPTSGYAGRDALPQLLCVLALVVVWSSLLPERRLSFRRRAGRSTSR
jgi:arabinofuranan 3-O-arabinosyltransferase